MGPARRTTVRWISVTALGALALGAIGCQADYAADLHNQAATPVFAQLMIKANNRDQAATLGASRRLGPGDRALIGPVRAHENPGSVYLVVDSLPNKARPATMDLAPGTSFLQIFEDQQTIRIIPKP